MADTIEPTNPVTEISELLETAIIKALKKKGGATAASMQVARQYLKDQSFCSIAQPGNQLDELEDEVSEAEGRKRKKKRGVVFPFPTPGDAASS